MRSNSSKLPEFSHRADFNLAWWCMSGRGRIDLKDIDDNHPPVSVRQSDTIGWPYRQPEVGQKGGALRLQRTQRRDNCLKTNGGASPSRPEDKIHEQKPCSNHCQRVTPLRQIPTTEGAAGSAA